MDDDSVSLSSKRWASYGQYHPFIEHWLELERISRLYNFVCGLDARGETDSRACFRIVQSSAGFSFVFEFSRSALLW